jgi:hypothetical protein
VLTDDLRLSTHVLHGFIVGNANCCICLDAMFEEKSSIGLDCGHIIHTECLQLATTKGAHACPLCRRPFRINADGTVTAAAPDAVGVARQPHHASPGSGGDVILDLLEEEGSSDDRRHRRADPAGSAVCCGLPCILM